MVTTTQRSSLVSLTLVLGMLTAFGAISTDIYLPALPSIASEFGTDIAAAQYTLSAFFIGMAFGQAFYGPLADRFGRKRPLLIGCALYTLASLGCMLAPSIGSLIALRFLQAIGACAGVVLARSCVRDLFDAHESARMYSLLMLVMGVAPILAPLLGGQLLIFGGWRAIFGLLLGFGLICFVMVITALPETLPPERRHRVGVKDALRVYGSLLRDRSFMGFSLTGGLGMSGMFAYITGSSFVFITLYGVSPQAFGFLFGANALGLISASQLNRLFLRHFESVAILRGALLVVCCSSLMLLGAAITGFGGLLGLMVPLFITIAGTGIISPNTAAAGMAPHGRIAGSASALMGTIQFVAGAAAGALVGIWNDGTAVPMAGVIVGCMLAAFASFTFLARPTM